MSINSSKTQDTTKKMYQMQWMIGIFGKNVSTQAEKMRPDKVYNYGQYRDTCDR